MWSLFRAHLSLPLSLYISLKASGEGFSVPPLNHTSMEQEQSRRSEPPRDPVAAEGFGTELTRPDSNAGGNITWTNEKHNLYLDSLEASFVAQLQNSLASRKKRCINADYPSDQFAVLQGSFWRKKIYEKDSPSPYGAGAGACHVIVGEKRLLPHKSASSGSSLSCHLRDEDNVGALAEGSGQNFTNEDQVERKNSSSSAKRFKNVAVYASSGEQIVPSQKSD